MGLIEILILLNEFDRIRLHILYEAESVLDLCENVGELSISITTA